jgi:hypothetical protein
LPIACENGGEPFRLRDYAILALQAPLETGLEDWRPGHIGWPLYEDAVPYWRGHALSQSHQHLQLTPAHEILPYPTPDSANLRRKLPAELATCGVFQGRLKIAFALLGRSDAPAAAIAGCTDDSLVVAMDEETGSQDGHLGSPLLCLASGTARGGWNFERSSRVAHGRLGSAAATVYVDVSASFQRHDRSSHFASQFQLRCGCVG